MKEMDVLTAMSKCKATIERLPTIEAKLRVMKFLVEEYGSAPKPMAPPTAPKDAGARYVGQ